MRPNHPGAERLLLLTLMLESAVEAEDWRQIDELLLARTHAIETCPAQERPVLEHLASIEERILETLRRRLTAVKSDMRNLTAALRIADPYARPAAADRLSLAS